jgi:hypothetical protein
MKITSGRIIWAISTFVWCLFMGVTAGSIGIGAILPQMNLIAKPFVCPNGQMTLEEHTSKRLPTTTYTQLNWFCVDQRTGARTPLGIFPMSLYAGLFYGLLFFLVVALIWSVIQLRHPAEAQAASNMQDPELAELANLERSSRASNQDTGRAARSSNKDTEMAELDNLERSGRTSNAQARLDELKQLRASNSITDAEYQKKRAEILKDL